MYYSAQTSGAVAAGGRGVSRRGRRVFIDEETHLNFWGCGMYPCARCGGGAIQRKVGDFEGSVKYIVMDEGRGFNVAEEEEGRR